MTKSPNVANRAAPSRAERSARNPDPSQAAGLSRHAEAGPRSVDIAGLRVDGSRFFAQTTVPALPQFEDAFSAFGRGTLLQSPTGTIAVEDLQPGDILRTSRGREARVMWIGSGTFRPDPVWDRQISLARISPDTFGPARPDGYLTLGTGARILHTPPHLFGQASQYGMLTPVRQFIDMIHVIEVTPPTPVTLFHIVLDRHATVRAGGLECESFHPGTDVMRQLSHADRDQFMSLFQHIGHISGFGPLAHPRAPEPDAEATGAA